MNKQLPSHENEVQMAVAKAIRRHLDANGLTRKHLIRADLSESTVNKLFQGVFTDRTLTKVDAILGTSFSSRDDKAQESDHKAQRDLGAYTFEAASYLQGEYLCVRPSFGNPANLSAYIIQIAWDRAKTCLVFEERSRADSKYVQSGVVYIPWGTPFFNLVTVDVGNVRTILLSLPDDDGVARGIMTTVQNPKGMVYIPTAVPVFLRRLQGDKKPELGVISPAAASYVEHSRILAGILADDFARFVMLPGETSGLELRDHKKR